MVGKMKKVRYFLSVLLAVVGILHTQAQTQEKWSELWCRTENQAPDCGPWSGSSGKKGGLWVQAKGEGEGWPEREP